MQSVAIYVGPYSYGGHWDERNLEIGHIGGSEIWLIENVFPEIRKQVPDFEISICGYFDDFNEPIFQQEGIKVLGNITKDELAREQMSSKIWIYPNHGINSVGGGFNC